MRTHRIPALLGSIAAVVVFSATAAGAATSRLVADRDFAWRTTSSPPACAALPNCDWNLADDVYQNMTGIPSNPLPDSLGDSDVWSYRAGGDGAAGLFGDFSGSWYGNEGLPAFAGDGGFPFAAMNTTASDMVPYNGESATAPSHRLIVHPSTTAPVIVEWTSPVDGTVSVAGAVTDRDPADAGGGAGDGVGWQVDLIPGGGAAVQIQHGSIPSGGDTGATQAFADGAQDGARSLGSVAVSRGDRLDFAVTADPSGAVPGNGNYWGDTTQLDVAIHQTTTTDTTTAPPSSGPPPAAQYQAGPAPFDPSIYVDLAGYTNTNEPAYPAPLTGPSIPQGVLTTGQEIFRGSNLTGTPACYGPDVVTCQISIDGPVNTPFAKVTSLAGGSQRLPTDRDGEYDVLAYAADSAGDAVAPNPWRYEVGEPPSAAKQTAAVSRSLAATMPLITRSPLTSLNGTSCPLTGTLPVGCFRTLTSASGQPLVVLGGDNSIVAAGGGNVVAAGGGNLTADQLAQIVSAGGGNVIGAGGGNVARLLSPQGDVLAIIAAGGGNLRIIAAGGGNVLATAAGQIVSAGSDNVVAAAAQIVSAGGGNITGAGAGSIIAAGGGNLVPRSGFAFAGAALGLATHIATDVGLTSMQLSTLSSSKAFGAAVRGHRRASGLVVAGGTVTASQKGTSTMLLKLTRKGARRLFAVARRNAAAARHHRAAAKLVLVVTETYTSTYAKAITVSRRIHVTPRRGGPRR